MAGEARTSPHRAAVGTGKNTPCQHQKGFYKCPGNVQNNQAIEEIAKPEMGVGNQTQSAWAKAKQLRGIIYEKI